MVGLVCCRIILCEAVNIFGKNKLAKSHITLKVFACRLEGPPVPPGRPSHTTRKALQYHQKDPPVPPGRPSRITRDALGCHLEGPYVPLMVGVP